MGKGASACLTAFLFAVGPVFAGTLTVEISPVSQVSPGPLIYVDILIAGLTPGAPPSIGDFDFRITFDPSIVQPESVVFGPYLGDPSASEALTTADLFSTKGVLEFAEVSLLDPSVLDTLQDPVKGAPMLLGTLAFSPAGLGTTSLDFSLAIAGDGFGTNLPLNTASGSITVVPESSPVSLVLLGAAALLFAGRRRLAGACVSIILLAPLASAQFVDILDNKEAKTKLSYKLGTTTIDPAAKGLMARIFRTPISLKNDDAVARQIIVCVTGQSVDLDGDPIFRHFQINMKVADSKIDCEILGPQKLAKVKYRLGAMGCQSFTVDAKKTLDVAFTSGNDRTVPVLKDADNVDVGKFKITGGYFGVGPIQDGKMGGVALVGTNQVGGHPLIAGSTSKYILKSIEKVNLQFVIPTDPKLGFKADADGTPRDKATFDCNKCFGMMPSLSGYYGFQLTLPGDADRKKIGAIFSTHWVNYTNKKLLESKTLAANINLWDDLTFSGAALSYPIPARLEPPVVNLPPACSITNIFPAVGTTFFISPNDSPTGTVEVTCGTPVPVGVPYQIIVPVSRLDGAAPELLTTNVVRMLNPAVCDVNLDGSIDSDDIQQIMDLANTPADGPDDPADPDRNLIINVNDARACTLLCTRPLCARPPAPL